MRVRITSVFERGYSTAFVRYEVGQVVDVDVSTAQRMQDAGCCEVLTPEVPVAVSLPEVAAPKPVVTPEEEPRAVVLPKVTKKAKR